MKFITTYTDPSGKTFQANGNVSEEEMKRLAAEHRAAAAKAIPDKAVNDFLKGFFKS